MQDCSSGSQQLLVGRERGFLYRRNIIIIREIPLAISQPEEDNHNGSTDDGSTDVGMRIALQSHINGSRIPSLTFRGQFTLNCTLTIDSETKICSTNGEQARLAKDRVSV